MAILSLYEDGVLGTAEYLNRPLIELNNAKLEKTETAVDAEKLKTPRNISLSGDVYGNADFDGSTDIVINATVNFEIAPNIDTTEYKLNLKRGSKDIYGIEVDSGNLLNTDVKIIPFTFNPSYTYWIDLQNSYASSTNEVIPLGYPGNVGESISISLDKLNNSIKIKTSDDKTNFIAKVVLLYTK